jgi:hypothetical protein
MRPLLEAGKLLLKFGKHDLARHDVARLDLGIGGVEAGNSVVKGELGRIAVGDVVDMALPGGGVQLAARSSRILSGYGGLMPISRALNFSYGSSHAETR